jgi:hypothetical protein
MFTAIRHSQQGMIGGFMYAHSTGAGCRTLALLVVSMLVTAKSAEAQLSPTRTKTFLTIPAPQSVTATYDPLGVVIAWQPVAEAGQYLILRAPDVYTAGAQIGSVLAGTVRFQDRGFLSAAAYQVVAVAPDGRLGTSAVVSYAPPAPLAIDKTQFSGMTRTTLATALPISPTYQPPGAYAPPVGAAIKPWNPSLHQVTWSTDGVHGYTYWQVYKLDPASPSGRLVRDRLQYREFWDSSFVAPNSTTYRIVGYSTDGTWGSADVLYPNPPQPAPPAPFSGIQVSTGAVKVSWQTLPGALRYRLFGATLPAVGLPVGSAGVSNLPGTYVVTGLPLGAQTFSIAAEYLAGVSPTARASTVVDVRPTSGNYRVLLKVAVATHESVDDPLSFDGRGDEFYAAAYWATFPFVWGAPSNAGVVQTRVYGDIHQAPARIQAGTASPWGGIRSGNVIPDGSAPVLQPGIATYTDRLPLLVWQGVLQDSGQILVVNPVLWESDNNATGNFPYWWGWWSTPNGSGILQNKAYSAKRSVPIVGDWLGRMEDNIPIQPPMTVSHGMDRPLGIGGLDLGWGSTPTPNANSLTPSGLILTRERIEQALGVNRALLLAWRFHDRPSLDGDYMLYIQIERMP